MLTIIAKKDVNGKWENVDGNELYTVGQRVTFANADEYMVTNISGSRITLELMVAANVN